VVDSSILGLADLAALELLELVAAVLCQIGLLVGTGNMVDCIRSIPNRSSSSSLDLVYTGHGMVLLGLECYGRILFLLPTPLGWQLLLMRVLFLFSSFHHHL